MIRPEVLSDKWPQKPLGEVVEFLDHLRRPITAKDRDPGPYPYYGANGQQDSVADYIFDEPLVLLAEDGGYFGEPERTIAYRVEGKCWVNNHAHVLRPKENIDLGFLCRVLEKYDVSKFINGATRAKLNKGIASTIPIPLPPLPEQRRIVAILDKADAIRRKRQQSIGLTEEFLRSVFLDMFGDPVLNPKGFDRQPLGEFATIIVDCPHSTPHYAENKTTFPCIRSSDLQDGNLVINKNTKYVDEEGYSKRVKRLVPEAGDIIYCREGARLGNSGIVPKGVTPCLGQRTMLFRVDSNRAASEFLLLLLNNAGIKKQIQNMVIGAAAPRVNIKDLKNFEVIMPPANLQKVFSEIYGNFVRTKSNQNDFLDKGGSLFNSLVQRAFRGEL